MGIRQKTSALSLLPGDRRQAGPTLLAFAAALALGGCHFDDEIEGQPEAGVVDAAPDGAAGCREGAVEACELAAGCRVERICVGGAFGECTAPEERCDDVDNDCDGTVDEGFAELGEVCSTGEGACAAEGVSVCGESGDDVVCDATAGAPVDELCNGLDDDCDGTADEDFGGGMPCETGEQGVCAAGTTACAAGGTLCARDAEPSAELCDGLDNDCDGSSDEGEDDGPLVRDCYDGPAETVGNSPCLGGTQTCEGGVYGACVGQVLPGEEICDGVDNDCDAEVDDVDGGCACLLGEVRDCYTGPDGTADAGACRMGTQSCLDDGSTFGPCAGEVVPAAEICASRDQDLDCDGDTDDVAGTGEACSVGIGACAAEGRTACGADDAIGCDALAGEPGVEVCDGVDNDCNGVIDDVAGLGDVCQVGIGACVAVGVQICDLEAEAVVCDAVPGQPVAEACDGVDNDCNGATDDVEGLADACQVGVGACLSAGVRICDVGAGALVCDAIAGGQQVEICDGIDNDCDGAIDDVDGLGDACSAGVGACRADGVQVCDVGGRRLVCDAQAGQQGAEICDGVDNDCNGQVDDVAGLGDNCSAGIGACQRNGSRVCDVGARQLVCDAQPGQPDNEICDGADNDCNGQVDDVVGTGAPCSAGVGACQRDGNRVCDAGAGQLVCNAQPGQPGNEICDGIDNDCNGQVDNVAGLGQACTAGQGICQRDGSRVCDVGARQLVCDAQPGAAQGETCDNRDQDCDGRTDEDVTQSCYPGPGGTQDVGACRAGTQSCNGGVFGACQGAVTPIAEFCSQQDNDCNGQIDDIFAEFQSSDFNADLQCFDFAIGDLNRNGRPDVVCSFNGNDGRLAYWHDAGLGNFGAVRYTAAAPQRMYKVEMADLDGDGDRDVVGVGGNMLPQVFINDNGNLRAPVQAFAAGSPSASGLALADMTGDRVIDIVTSLGPQGANFRLAIARGNGDGTFAAPAEPATCPDLYDIAVGDIDQDGDLDVLGLTGGSAGVLRANGGGNFANYAQFIGFPNFPQKMMYADFTGDGRRDLVVGTEARWFFGRAQGADFAFVETADRGTIMAVAAADLDCDPLLEVVMTRSNPGSPFVIVGEPPTQGRIFERFSAHGWGVEGIDLTGDGLDDLILPNDEGGFHLLRQLP